MKHRKLIRWALFILFLLFSFFLAWTSVGVGMAWGDYAGPKKLPRPEILDDIDIAFVVLGFPIAYFEQVLANDVDFLPPLRTLLAIVSYMANGWLLSYLLCEAILRIYEKFKRART